MIWVTGLRRIWFLQTVFWSQNSCCLAENREELFCCISTFCFSFCMAFLENGLFSSTLPMGCCYNRILCIITLFFSIERDLTVFLKIHSAFSSCLEHSLQMHRTSSVLLIHYFSQVYLVHLSSSIFVADLLESTARYTTATMIGFTSNKVSNFITMLLYVHCI